MRNVFKKALDIFLAGISLFYMFINSAYVGAYINECIPWTQLICTILWAFMSYDYLKDSFTKSLNS